MVLKVAVGKTFFGKQRSACLTYLGHYEASRWESAMNLQVTPVEVPELWGHMGTFDSLDRALAATGAFVRLVT